MKKLVALVVAMTIMVGGCAQNTEPLGVRLQKAAGNSYEVIYNPTTGIYTVEPK